MVVDGKMVRVAFGNAVRKRRRDAGLSQEALAHLASLDRTYISGIERGVRNPSLENIVRIAEGLGARPDQLFEGFPDV